MPALRFSVIIPAYQEEVCLPALLGQVARFRCLSPGTEIIVSDGGSTDRTVEIGRSTADATVTWDAPAQQNIATGRNRGAREAHGDVLMFLNADVSFDDPEAFFREAVRVMGDDRTLAATCAVAVRADERRLSDRLFHGAFNAYCRFLNTVGIGMGRGECHIIRREIFERLGGYDERIAAGEDFELFHRIRRRGNIAFMNNVVVYESPRRYRVMGYARVAGLWFANAVSVLLFRRSMSRKWLPIR